jgi:membrane protease YdiL (CAAX protease family)
MLLYAARDGDLGSPSWGRLVLAPVAVFFAVIFGPLGEELGWRGYALPRLQQRYSALTSSLSLGLVWTLWHIPMFWGPGGTVVSGGPVTFWAIGKYVLYLSGFSILYTWLFNNTRGSVLLAVIFHTSANAVLPLVAFPDRAGDASRLIDEWSVVAIWIMALLALVIHGPQKLTRGEVPTP